MKRLCFPCLRLHKGEFDRGSGQSFTHQKAGNGTSLVSNETNKFDNAYKLQCALQDRRL
jgi:hypothetical protein